MSRKLSKNAKKKIATRKKVEQKQQREIILLPNP
jgi:hypothetical protein